MGYIYIYLLLQPALNPKSYGRARVLEIPSRPMLVIGRSFYEEMVVAGEITGDGITVEGITVVVGVVETEVTRDDGITKRVKKFINMIKENFEQINFRL